MNIDELKKAIATDTKDIDIQLSLEVKKSTQSSLNKVRKRLIVETWAYLLVFLVLIEITFFRNLHQSAQGLLFYTSFICFFTLCGAVVFQIKLINKLKITEDSSKKFIEKSTVLIRSFVDYSKFVLGGASVALFISLFIPKYGYITLDEKAVTEFLYFKEFTIQHLQAIGLVLTSVMLAYVISSWYYKKYYLIEIKKLENLIDDF